MEKEIIKLRSTNPVMNGVILEDWVEFITISSPISSSFLDKLMFRFTANKNRKQLIKHSSSKSVRETKDKYPNISFSRQDLIGPKFIG